MFRNLENEVEAVRSGVLNSNKKLKMTEVEQLTIRLARLGGEAAALKGEALAPVKSRQLPRLPPCAFHDQISFAQRR